MNADRIGLELHKSRNGAAPRITPPLRTETGRATTAVSEAKTPAHKPRPALVAGGMALLLLGGVAGLYGWNHARTWVTTDNAYVSGHVHSVSTRVAGTVNEVLVSDNQDVAAGTVLARLDASDFKLARDKAEAALAQAKAQSAQAQAQVLRDIALAGKAQADFDRADKLFHDTGGVISKSEFDSAKSALDAANAALNASKALVLAAQAQVKVATAQFKDAELQLGYTEIVAPAAGRVGRKNLEVGNRVQAGQALLALVEPRVWVTANFKETQLERLHPGQRVSLRLDSFPGHKFTGAVESLSPASAAEFALLPPDNATGNFTKIVQRVPVKVIFDEASVCDFTSRIVPGMSVVVKVNVRD